MKWTIFFRLAAVLAVAVSLRAQQYRIDTFAGGVADGDSGPATSALLLQAQGLAADSQGRLYVADAKDHRVRRIELDGSITTVAGNGIAGYSGDGGPAAQAQLRNPYGLVIDANDNLYIADLGNSRVREVTAGGNISTIAGGGLVPPGGDNDGGPATDYGLGAPRDLLLDATGDLFISDFNRNQVYEVTPDGTLNTVAGTGDSGYSGDFGAAVLATLSSPAGLALWTDGSVLVCDSGNHVVRRIAGESIQPFFPTAKPGAQSTLTAPSAIAVNRDGSFLVADAVAGLLYRVDALGRVTTFNVAAGDLLIDAAGETLLSAQGFVERLNPDGTVQNLAGSSDSPFYGEDVAATNARLSQPADVTAGSNGAVYIADTGANRIRRVGLNGVIATFAGDGAAGYTGDGGPATSATLNAPMAVAFDANGNLLIADTGNNVIRLVAPGGGISTVAGTGAAGSAPNGTAATLAPLNAPAFVAAHNGNLYISDTGNHSVVMENSSGVLTRIAGNGTAGDSGDGAAATAAELDAPRGLTFDTVGNLYIADGGAGTVRRVDTHGIITTVTNSSNGPWAAPWGILAQTDGSLLVSDSGTHEVRAILANGSSTVIAGTGSVGFSGDTGPAVTAQLNAPEGLAASADGSLYIADAGNSRIRVLSTAAPAIPANVATVQVVNSASRLGGAVAPGELVDIVGAGVGGTEPFYSDASASTLPFALGDSEVLINGRRAPMVSAQPGDIEIQIPYELEGAEAAELEVLSQGVPVGVASLTIAASNPGIYTLDGSGSGPALALSDDGELNDLLNPADPGSMLTLFITGDGLSTGANQTGVAVSGAATPQLPVSVYANLIQAQVVAVRELPGAEGLLAVTFAVPANALASFESIQVVIGSGVSQPGVKIWLQAPIKTAARGRFIPL